MVDRSNLQSFLRTRPRGDASSTVSCPALINQRGRLLIQRAIARPKRRQRAQRIAQTTIHLEESSRRRERATGDSEHFDAVTTDLLCTRADRKPFATPFPHRNQDVNGPGRMTTAGGTTQRQRRRRQQRRPRRRRPDVVHMRGLFWLVPLVLLLGLATPPGTRAREVDVGSATPRRLRRARHHRHSAGSGASKAAAAATARGSEGGCVRVLIDLA